MIRAVALSRSFGGRQAVREATFRVESGEVVGLLGPNGAGKTTTMRMILGLLRPSAGEATVDGRVGYLPESFTAYDPISVRSCLRFLSRMKRLPDDEVERALSVAGAADLGGRPFGRLSKGQRQRVGIAQAVLGSPPAYVLDEPTVGLDPRQVVEARSLVRGLADDGAAVLVSTHLLAEAAAMCDRVVVMAAGRVVAEEPLVAGAPPGDLEQRFLRLVGEAELT